MYPTIHIACPEQPQTIRPALFGCNLEVTRRTFWAGLSAQMLNNRKFFAGTEEPCAWKLAGDAVYSREETGCRVRLAGGGSVLQDVSVRPLCRGRAYQIRVLAAAQGDITLSAEGGGISAAWTGIGGEPQTLTATISAPGDWECFPFCLRAEGTGAVTLYAVSLMEADHFHGMRRDVLERLKELAPAELRFPGGCFAEVYRWKDSLLPPDQRPPVQPTLYEGDFLLGDTFGQDCMDLGIDEFMALCAYVGAAPVLTVPMIIISNQDGIDLVEYCNGGPQTAWGRQRAERGHPAPYAVRDWYVGNELYYFGRRLREDPSLAAEETRALVAAMKAVDPSIRIIGCFCPSLPEWTAGYLRGAAAVLDALSLHFYLTDPFAPNRHTMSDTVRARVLPDAFVPLLKEGKQLADSLLEQSLPFSLDEWGYNWGERGTPVSMTVDALLLTYLCAHADDWGIEKALYFHPINEGLILAEPKEARLDYTGRVFRLFAGHRGAQRLEAKGAGDGLAAAASWGPEGLLITLVNAARQNTQRFRLTGDRLSEGTEGHGVILTAGENGPEDTLVSWRVGDVCTLPPGAVAAIHFLQEA